MQFFVSCLVVGDSTYTAGILVRSILHQGAVGPVIYKEWRKT